jgi:hypothetical protein
MSFRTLPLSGDFTWNQHALSAASRTAGCSGLNWERLEPDCLLYPAVPDAETEAALVRAFGVGGEFEARKMS